MRIDYTATRFVRPEELSVSQYEELRKMSSSEFEAMLASLIKYDQEEHNPESKGSKTLILWSAVILGVATIGSFLTNGNPLFMTVAGSAAFILIGAFVGGYFHTQASFRGFLRQKQRYYRSLKYYIDLSTSYENFCAIYFPNAPYTESLLPLGGRLLNSYRIRKHGKA